MLTRTTTSLIPLFCLALAACSDDDTGGGGGGGGGGGTLTITHDNIVDQYLQTVCQLWVNCSDEWGGTFDSVSECIAFFGAEAEADLAGIDDPDLYDIDSDSAKACLSAVAASTCDRDPLFDTNPDCQAAIVGKLVQDDCCDERDGCAPGLFCDGADATTTGTCQPRATEGNDCSNAQCEPGLYCDENTLCAQPKGQGVSCLDLDDECGELSCIGGSCLPNPLIGDTCDLTDDQCPMASMCLDTTGTPTCQPCPFCSSGGDPCDPQQGMTFKCFFAYVFFADFYCEPDTSPSGGTCNAMPGLGGDCSASFICDPIFDLYCHEDATSGDRDCRQRQPDGTACDPQGNDICMAGSDCDSTTMTCLPENPDPTLCP